MCCLYCLCCCTVLLAVFFHRMQIKETVSRKVQQYRQHRQYCSVLCCLCCTPQIIFLAQPLLDLSPNRYLHLILPYPAVQPVLCLVLCVCVLHVVLQYHYQQPLGAPDLCRQFLSQIVHMPYVVRVIHNSRCALYFVYELTPTSYCLCSAAKGVAVCNLSLIHISEPTRPY